MDASDRRADAHIAELAKRARGAADMLATAPRTTKDAALSAAASLLRGRVDALMAANAEDLAALGADVAPAHVDRLRLTPERIGSLADAVLAVAALPDPVGRVLARIDRPNGLLIERVAVPIGVIGMIYEARPNVGADAGALAVKSGNAIILRGGSDSRRSNAAIIAAMRAGLAAAGLPEAAIQSVEDGHRATVSAMLRAVGAIDLVIPRGGRGLVSLVRDEARVPTLLHLDGNCHSYVHEKADIAKAVRVIRNAKMRRTGICGATESIVVDRALAGTVVPALCDAMPDCELRGDPAAVALDPRIVPARETDWDTEYLDAIASVRIVEGLPEAIAFVRAHSSGHSDAIITEDPAAAAAFMAAIDSAIVLHNASTQFADGGEFGMGAEIGIATGKLHARGPVGLEQLTSYKYLVHGNGQVRA